MKKKTLYLLAAIVVLGLLIRLFKISSASLYGDELTIAYDAYSLFKTGRDQTGQAWPVTFKMGAGRPAGYVYGTIPFIASFGLNALGVRGLSVLSGMGIIVLMYFLGKKLFSEKVGLISSFLTSISLWDIYLSRGGFEAHFALFLSLFGVVLFLYKRYVWFAVFWGLAIFTYPTFKLTLPLLFLVLAWFNGFKNIVKNKKFIVSILLLFLFALFSLFEFSKGLSEERFSNINVFSNNDIKENIIQTVTLERNKSNLPDFIKPLFYNKPIKYTKILLDNYFENLSIDFLFINGDGNPRHNPGEWGMLYLVDLPLILAGLYLLFKKDKKIFTLLVSWVLIVPIAPMLIKEPAHALRNNFLVPPLLIILGYGVSKVNKKYLKIYGVAVFVQFVWVMAQVYFLAPYKFGSFYSLRAKEVSEYVISNKEKYDQVILSSKIDNIEYAYPVYAKLDPNLVISQYGKLPKSYGNVIVTDKTEEYETTDRVYVLEE